MCFKLFTYTIIYGNIFFLFINLWQINELNNLRQMSDGEAYRFFHYEVEFWKNRTCENKINFENYSNENLKIIWNDRGVKLEFYENKAPNSRLILFYQLEKIFNKLTSYDSIEISKIDKCSWVCVLLLKLNLLKIIFPTPHS